MARLRNGCRNSDRSEQWTWRLFGSDNLVRNSRCETGRSGHDLRPAREATALSSHRMRSTRPGKRLVVDETFGRVAAAVTKALIGCARASAADSRAIGYAVTA